MAESVLAFPRPERHCEPVDASQVGIIERPLSRWTTLANNAVLRRTLILVALACMWELYARWLNNALLVPTFTATVAAFIHGIATGLLPAKVWTTVSILVVGYAVGVFFAALLATLAITTRIGNDFLETLTAMCTPLPAIALLPLALIWFGFGWVSLVFVLVQSVLWPVALNTHMGFLAVSPTLRMVGRNYGLRNLAYVATILVPAAFPSILTGLKIGWAFGWRTLIAAELIFGVTSGHGGLGWFIYESKSELDIPSVFAGLLTVVIIGLFMENVVFRTVEERTIRRWGMAG